MGRMPCCEKVGLKKGRWTVEEDEILAKYIKDNGEGFWRSMPKNAGLLRCGKSCRLRWMNYLRSDLKRGNISADEDDMIVKLHASLGNRWSLIASHLPGRSDNEIKNYWNSHLCRSILVFRRAAISEVIPVAFDASNISKRRGDRPKRRGKRTNNSVNLEGSSSLSIIETVNEDVPLPFTAELEREAFVGTDVGENNSEKDSYGAPFVWSYSRVERETETSMQKDIETVEGPCRTSINGSLLGLNDLIESRSVDITEECLTVVDERESGKSMEEKENGNYCHNKIAVIEKEDEEVNRSVNNGVWQSLFSIASSFDDSEIWGWENLVQVEELRKEDETTILPSLWEEDDWILDSIENDEQRNHSFMISPLRNHEFCRKSK